MSYGRHINSRSHKKVVKVSGNTTLNSTSWANIDTGLDVTLAAQVGDDLEVAMFGLMDSQAVEVFLDAVTLVSGSPVNSFGMQAAAPTSTTGGGAAGWNCPASVRVPVSGALVLTMQSGDLSSGFVTVRFRYRSASATNRTLYSATADWPLQVFAWNHSPPDPN